MFKMALVPLFVFPMTPLMPNVPRSSERDTSLRDARELSLHCDYIRTVALVGYSAALTPLERN